MIARLGDVCVINPKAPEFDNKHLVSFVPMQKVTENGEIDTSESKEYYEVKKGFTYFQENDVLFAKITPCMENGKGAVATSLANGVGFGSTEFHVLRPIPELADSKWLYYVTVWDIFRRECEKNMTGSAGQKRVPKSFVENFEVSLPTLPKQRYIAAILDKISDLIALRKQQLDKLDELVKARFVEMFGNENDFGRWPCCTVGDVAEVGVGVVIKPTQYYADQGIPAFRSLNIGNMYVKDYDWVYFTQEGHAKNQKSIIRENDVLVVRSGAPGTACVATSKYAGYNAVDIIIAHPDNSKIESTFLATFTNMPHGMKQVKEKTGGAAQQHFNVGGYKSLQLIMPPLELQNKFSDYVGQVDKCRLTIQQGLDKLEMMKKALMQKYFG